MNDKFLHNIRKDPPQEFLARLKSRLDLQPPPTTPSPKGSTFRKVLLGLLLTGSAFAITLMLLNRGEPVAPATVSKSEPAQAKAPETDHPARETHNAPVRQPTKVKPIPVVKSTTVNAATNYYLTTTALEQYLRSLFSGNRFATVLTAESATDAVTRLCDVPKDTPAPVYALVAGHIDKPDSEICALNAKISKMLVGHQAIVLARSKLYGTFSLTPAEIFLALAAEVPDPAHPDKLIPNPNTTWSDISGSLEQEPIEFFGPEPSSPIGAAFREILFEPGCHALQLEKCPGLRKDGVYTEAAATTVSDMALKLQTKPNAIGILPLGFAFSNTGELAASPIRGVVPTTETIANETYPGSRPLYVYINQDAVPRARFISPNAFRSYTAEQYAVIPLERSQP
jgi:phosphate transport system substrate-binding protein